MNLWRESMFASQKRCILDLNTSDEQGGAFFSSGVCELHVARVPEKALHTNKWEHIYCTHRRGYRGKTDPHKSKLSLEHNAEKWL